MASKRKEELDEAYEKGKALIREDKQKAKRNEALRADGFNRSHGNGAVGEPGVEGRGDWLKANFGNSSDRNQFRLDEEAAISAMGGEDRRPVGYWKERAQRVADATKGGMNVHDAAAAVDKTLDRRKGTTSQGTEADDTLDAKMSWNKISKPIKSASKSKTTK